MKALAPWSVTPPDEPGWWWRLSGTKLQCFEVAYNEKYGGVLAIYYPGLGVISPSAVDGLWTRAVTPEVKVE